MHAHSQGKTRYQLITHATCNLRITHSTIHPGSGCHRLALSSTLKRNKLSPIKEKAKSTDGVMRLPKQTERYMKNPTSNHYTCMCSSICAHLSWKISPDKVWNVLKQRYMPLFLAALTIAIASYMAYQRIRFKNCKESRTRLHVLYFTKVNFFILHHCSEPYTGYP